MRWGIITITIIAVLVIGLRWHFVALAMPDKFFMTVDCLFSPSCRSAFENELLSCVQKKKSIHDIVFDLKNIFPHIKNISINYRPSGGVVHIYSYKPVCVVNETFLFVSEGYIFDRSLFSFVATEQLPSILVSQDIIAQASSIIPNVLKSIPLQMHATHTVDIVNKQCVTLTDKNNKEFTIICSADQFPEVSLFDQCEKVKKNIVTHAPANKNGTWTIDTRFADYIVAYRA